MNKNLRLLYSILGSFILTLLNNPIFEYSRLGIFENTRGLTFAMIYQIYNFIINIISFVGFVLLIVFSIKLVINNTINKDK
ncbi:MAG: hypothetical protein AB7V48_17285 [Sedimentibacter sp.]